MCLVVDVYADKKPFKNGGECSSSGDSYICSCVEGFQGKKKLQNWWVKASQKMCQQWKSEDTAIPLVKISTGLF